MPDAYFWVAFFGAPLFLLLATALVFRPSSRERYREAKQLIFADDITAHASRAALAHSDKKPINR